MFVKLCNNINNTSFAIFSHFLMINEKTRAKFELSVLDQYSTIENPFFHLWLISSLISSIYSYMWDIKLDWGLFDPKAGDNKFLREEIVYSSTVSEFVGGC